MSYSLYPITICQARYGGVYEGGEWVAFLAYPQHIPDDAFEDDITCATWWAEHHDEVGVGDTPSAAYENLKFRQERGTLKDFSAR